MDILLIRGCQGGYHREQRPDARHREATRWRRDTRVGQAGGRDGDDALNAGIKPDDADPPEPLLDGDADQREGETVEGMSRIRDGDGLSRSECGQADRGSL
jgi:hypothetical protein